MTEMNQIQFDFAKLQEEMNEKKRTLKLNQNTDAKLNLNIYMENKNRLRWWKDGVYMTKQIENL